MPKKAFSAERLLQLRDASEVLDAVLADLAARRFDALSERLSGPAPVRIIHDGQDWRGRGEEGRARLVAELTGDAALHGRQVRGDVYAALPLHTLVATYVTADGRSHRADPGARHRGGRAHHAHVVPLRGTRRGLVPRRTAVDRHARLPLTHGPSIRDLDVAVRVALGG